MFFNDFFLLKNIKYSNMKNYVIYDRIKILFQTNETIETLMIWFILIK